MKFSEYYREIEADGWYINAGSKHMKYVHPTKKGFIPVGRHKSKEVPTGTLKSMRRISGTGQ
jgi:predicted RNA binding protein YcfA (HicA-like mRNA interferase family)